MHDLMRDWRRWTPLERFATVALLALLLALAFAFLLISRGAS